MGDHIMSLAKTTAITALSLASISAFAGGPDQAPSTALNMNTGFYGTIILGMNAVHVRLNNKSKGAFEGFGWNASAGYLFNT